MRRRDFVRGAALLLAGGAAACKEGDKTKAGREPAANEVATLAPQLEPCPFVFAGERLAHLRGGVFRGLGRSNELVVRRSGEWKVERTFALKSGHGIGALSDSSVLVYEDALPMRMSLLKSGEQELRNVAGSLLSTHSDRRSRIFPRPSASEFFFATTATVPRVELIDLSGPELTSKKTFELKYGNDFDGLASLADRSLIYPGSGLVTRLDETGSKRELATTVRIDHVAQGPTSETVWAGALKGGLRLLALSDPMTILASAPGRIYHLAAADKFVAAIVAEQQGGSVTKAELVVRNADATVLWRVRLPRMELPINRVKAHWVAASPEAVAVGTTNDMTVYDASSGRVLSS